MLAEPVQRAMPATLSTRVPVSRASPNNVALGAPPGPESGPKLPCRYFANGSCTRGEGCLFAHEAQPKSSAPGNLPPILQQATDTRPQIACQFFAKGSCRNGDACPFAHAQADTTKSAQGEDEQEQDEGVFNEEPPPDDWARQLGGALVQFEDGAAISKISPPTDFSAVRLNKLPEGSSPTSVAALLVGMGLVVSPQNVRVVTQTGHCSADVTVEDPMFAKTVCTKLRSGTATLEIEAVPIPVPMPRGSSLHRVDCRRVHCSWHRPARTAWLNFGAENIARKVHERFNAGIYKLLGCNVKASAPTGEGNRWNPLAWTVMLTDLAGTVTERDIYQAIPEFNKPRRVVMGKTSCDVDIDSAAATVKSMLLEFGPLEWWEVSTNAKGKRIKAQARFFDESHAREAASTLDNKPLSFSKTARLTIRLPISAKFKISARIYDALNERLGSQTPVWEIQHLRFVAYPPLRGYRVLKLEAEDSRLLAKAKETLERIVAGEVVKKDGKDLWSPGLARNGDEYKRLKQVERDYGVVIVRDRRKSQLRLFGPEGACRLATEALETLIPDGDSTAASDTHAIELNVDEFQWACRGGFKALTSQLGDNKATFDVTSTPKRILIGGSKADYTAALAIIASRQIGPVAALSDAQTDCPVCLTDAEEPTRTSCGHVYCADCFSSLCQAEGSSSTEFRICCAGGEGRCEKILPLSELQDLLSSAAFDAVLEASFASYIRRHPTDFRYCPTPDCGQIYRPAADGATMIFTCSKCLIPTCTSCHSPHPGITCAEHKNRASGGYEALERVKKELGIKDCPKCKTAMEKTGGCNHMTCSGCGTHICWVCMAVFGTSGQCYDHLSKMHGGAFDYEHVF